MAKFKELKDFDRQVIDWIAESAKGHSKECIYGIMKILQNDILFYKTNFKCYGTKKYQG